MPKPRRVRVQIDLTREQAEALLRWARFTPVPVDAAINPSAPIAQRNLQWALERGIERYDAREKASERT